MRTNILAVLGVLCIVSPARAVAPGALDAAFGSDGVVTLPIALGRPTSILEQPDQRLVVLGAGGAARFLADGTPDAAFGTAGVVASAISASAAALQSDGSIVGAGSGGTPFEQPAFGVVRFTAAGVRDPAFGDDGEVVIDVGSRAWATAVAVQSDGKIVVAGSRDPSSPDEQAAVVRLGTDGAPDPTFGAAGILLPAVGRMRVTGLALQPGIGIVLAGIQNGDHAVLLRLDESGAIDPSFGTAGIVDLSPCGYDEPFDLLRQPDGKLLVGGSCYQSGGAIWQPRALLARFDADGSPDLSFDGDGVAILPQLAGLNAIALAPDGRILGVPDAGSTSKGDFAVARFTTNGALDPTFGGGGFVSVALGDGGAETRDAVVQGDGNVVLVGLAGNAMPPGAQLPVLARFAGAAGSCTTDRDCSVCESCSAGACAMRPRTGCAAAAPGGARLDVAWAYDSAYTSRAVALFKWDWRGGTAPPATLLDPTTSDDVGACIFHSGSGWRVLETVAPAATSCGTRPCWSATPAGGFRFRGDRDGTLDGLRTITIDATRVKVGARGEALEGSLHGIPYPGAGHADFHDPAAPSLLSEDLVVQLQSGSGACWSATYSDPARESAKEPRTRILYKAVSD